MLIGPADFRRAYDDIRQSSLTHSTLRVVIFVSCLDIDALCAAKVLANTFKTDLIPHKLVPVVGYDEMRSMYAELDDDVANVICIGCGATVDLEAYLDTSEDGEEEEPGVQAATRRKVHVIDNHRPWNLDNLFGSQSVVCWDDGTAAQDLPQHEEAYAFLVNDDESDDESEEDDEEIDDDDDPELGAGGLDDNGDTDDDNDDKVVMDGQSSNKRERAVDTDRAERKRARQERRALREKHTALLEEYYGQGTFVRSSSTTQVYSLLSVIGETTPMNLWLTVVGVTSLDAQYPQVYAALYPLLKDEVQRLTSGGNAGTDDSSLFIETDYSLFLLRHWSLYESMLHSSYLSAKLTLWTEDGRKKLHKMLARMGIALHESKEQWTHMAIPLKRSLKDKLAGVSGAYGIEEVIRRGIVRRYGFKGSVSAGDAVDAVAALLAATVTFASDTANSAYPTPPSEAGGATTAATVDATNLDKFWVSSFWNGWDALDNFELLMEGVSRAKALQQAVVAAGTVLFEKRQIKDLRLFRLAVVKDGADLHVFRNPLALTRLGVWIAEGCAEAHLQPLPLVVASFDPDANAYLVLGMGPRKPRDSGTAAIDMSEVNKFGTAFQRTAERVNARVRMDGFESSVIQVARDDLSRFLEALTVSGLVA